MEFCNQALQDDPSCAEATLQKGFVFARQGYRAEAEKAWRDGLASGDARSKTWARVELNHMGPTVDDESLEEPTPRRTRQSPVRQSTPDDTGSLMKEKELT